MDRAGPKAKYPTDTDAARQAPVVGAATSQASLPNKPLQPAGVDTASALDPGGGAAASALDPEPGARGCSDNRLRLDRRRLLTAFALTPLLAGFYPAIFLAEPAVMPLGLLVAYVSALLLGIPLVFYFDRRRHREWWIYTAGGATCALPSIVLYALAPLPAYLVPFGLIPVIDLLLWGGSSGLVFWMIGVAGESPVSLKTLFDPVSSRK